MLFLKKMIDIATKPLGEDQQAMGAIISCTLLGVKSKREK